MTLYAIIMYIKYVVRNINFGGLNENNKTTQ